MGYERYPRGTDPQRDDHGARDPQDYGRDYGAGRSYSYSSARDYAAAGAYGRDDDDGGYGRRDHGPGGYAQGDRSRDRTAFGAGDDSRSGYGRSSYGGDYQRGYARDAGPTRDYRGSYASDGRRFEDVGSYRHRGDDDRGGRDRGGYGRQPQGYDYDDRGFLSRAGDEVRSWFGDEEAERRREMDSRYDERYYNQQGRHDRDSDYHSWRSGQIAALDRDYDEYRQENRSRFENEFSSWRTNRQTQRQSLDQVKEHAEVIGSDGTHVGTVDKVRGDRILLTKTDADAGGRHHSIPSSWLQSVDEKKVTLSKTADEAKRRWRDEEQNQALFRYGDNNDGRRERDVGTTTDLNRSFSGTYDKKS